jgi:hypothetical protein
MVDGTGVPKYLVHLYLAKVVDSALTLKGLKMVISTVGNMDVMAMGTRYIAAQMVG